MNAVNSFLCGSTENAGLKNMGLKNRVKNAKLEHAGPKLKFIQ